MGAPAYDPAILLKIVLLAYSRGILSSQRIAQACRENVTFMALTADSQPHFTTIADFISTMHKEAGALFVNVLLICSEEGLIGRQMFAVDSRRMGIVEPVFANICATQGMNRLTLRGKIKVNLQWLLYCIVHNVGKIFRYSPKYRPRYAA